MSARNKKNRAANELPPTVGSRSVARIIDMVSTLTQDLLINEITSLLLECSLLTCSLSWILYKPETKKG